MPSVLYTEQDPGVCEGTSFRCPEKAPLESQEGMIRPQGGAWQHNLGGMFTPQFLVLPDFSFSANYKAVESTRVIRQVPLLSRVPFPFPYCLYIRLGV